MKHISQILRESKFCEGTWAHKYNTALNERIAEAMGVANGRTAADTGECLQETNFDHDENNQHQG